MTLAPLLHAPLAVQIHVATVVPAFFLGTYQIFLSRKGAPFHQPHHACCHILRLLGRVQYPL